MGHVSPDYREVYILLHGTNLGHSTRQWYLKLKDVKGDLSHCTYIQTFYAESSQTSILVRVQNLNYGRCNR